MKMYLIELSNNSVRDRHTIFNDVYNKIKLDNPNANIFMLQRVNGYENNKRNYFDFVNSKKDENTIILTDDETMLNFMSTDLFTPISSIGYNLNLYFYYPDTKEILKASDLITKDLRPAHNLLKLYYANAFEKTI
jgi:hypothetical protein